MKVSTHQKLVRNENEEYEHPLNFYPLLNSINSCHGSNSHGSKPLLSKDARFLIEVYLISNFLFRQMHYLLESYQFFWQQNVTTCTCI